MQTSEVNLIPPSSSDMKGTSALIMKAACSFETSMHREIMHGATTQEIVGTRIDMETSDLTF
jgi:hypothetical protein